jgi:hypothetical protein
MRKKYVYRNVGTYKIEEAPPAKHPGVLLLGGNPSKHTKK